MVDIVDLMLFRKKASKMKKPVQPTIDVISAFVDLTQSLYNENILLKKENNMLKVKLNIDRAENKV